MREIEDMEGVRIGGKVVNNLRYAVDTVILAKSEQQLKQLINTVVTESELKGLRRVESILMLGGRNLNHHNLYNY